MDEYDFSTNMTAKDAARLRTHGAPGEAHRPRSMMRPLARIGRGTDLASIDPSRDLQAQDQIQVFQQVIIVIRWGVLGFTLILATPRVVESGERSLLWLSAAFALLTIGRHLSPIRFSEETRGDLGLLGELTMGVLAISATGIWRSPFAVTLVVPILVAGFARGHRHALKFAALTSLVPSFLVVALEGLTSDAVQDVLLWSLILSVAGLLAGQTRRISGDADRQHTLAMNRMERLTDANSLLYSLHRVAQTLPASLDLNDVLDTTMGRLRGLFDYSSVALLLFDETDASWQVMRSEGLSLPLRLGPTKLPNPLKNAIAQNRLIDIPSLSAARSSGLSAQAESGLYTTLTARGQIIGLLAMEHSEKGHYSERTVQMFNGFVDPVALAVDNARWFGRLRTMGADEERGRIARDLHDRIGQSMAFLAFEIDRIVKKNGEGKDVGDSLATLRDDVRNVIREIRDTLSDLRTDVSDSQGFEETVSGFAERLADRSGLEIDVLISASDRMPIMQERELWRIAQEAMVNVERHAEASRIDVNWTSDGARGVLEIIDDGRGFTMGESGRIDSYGLVGMRERAGSIGATMEVVSTPGSGTTIRCSVDTFVQQRLAA